MIACDNVSGLNTNRCSYLFFRATRSLLFIFVFLILGVAHCGLGSVLIPLLKDGWVFGQDVNPATIDFGEEVLRDAGISEQAPYTLFFF